MRRTAPRRWCPDLPRALPRRPAGPARANGSRGARARAGADPRARACPRRNRWRRPRGPGTAPPGRQARVGPPRYIAAAGSPSRRARRSRSTGTSTDNRGNGCRRRTASILVELRPQRLALSVRHPDLQRWPGPDGIAVCLGGARDRNRVGAHPRDHRRIERVGDAGFLAEQERAAALFQAVLPDGDDPVHLRLGIRPQHLVRVLLENLHRAVVAQIGEAGMHLGRQRPRARPLGGVLRPEALVRELLVEILGDGEGIPDGDVAVDQRRHASARRILADVRGGIRHVERDDDLLERHGGVLEHQPGAQRPRGVLLVPDDDLQHGTLLITTAAARGERGYHDAARGNLRSLRWQTRTLLMRSPAVSWFSTAPWAQRCSGCSLQAT